MTRAYRGVMCSSLVSILARIATEPTLPHMVSVSLNGTHMGDIKTTMLPLLLSGLPTEVGDVITLDEVFDEWYDWFQEGTPIPLVIYHGSSGWILDSLQNETRESVCPASQTHKVRRNTKRVTKEDNHYWYGFLPGAKALYKKMAAKLERRLSRSIIEEGKVG